MQGDRLKIALALFRGVDRNYRRFVPETAAETTGEVSPRQIEILRFQVMDAGRVLADEVERAMAARKAG